MAKTKRTEDTNAILPPDVPRKPLLFDRNPFDDERLDDLEFAAAHKDGSYVPGYSEIKAENQLRAARGKPLHQTARLQWVRIAKRGGMNVTESDEGMIDWMRLGYRACGIADLESNGWGFPPTAHVGADGLIRRGDLALFIVGGERADRNRVLQKRINEEFVSREPSGGDSGEIYEVRKERVDQAGSLTELSKLDLPTLE